MIKQDFRQFELVFLVVISSLQCIFGLTGNLISLLTIICSERLNQVPSNLFIFNLAVSDLLTCVVFLPFHIRNLFLPSIGENLRFYYHALCLFHVFSNGNAILVITIDRFIAVSCPLRYKTFVTKRRAIQVIFMSWIMPLSFAIAFFTSLQKDSPESSEHGLRAYIVASLIAVLVLYFMVFMAVRKQRQKIRTLSLTTQDSAKTFRIRVHLWKSTVNTFLLVLFYFLTYLPILSYDFKFSLNKQQKYTVVSERVYAWVLSFQFLNSCIDPFLYVFRCQQYKVAFLQLLSRVFVCAVT